MLSPRQTIVGIDIGGTKCAVSCYCEESNSVKEVLRFPTTHLSETIDRLVDGVRSLGIGDEAAIGISCGGPLDEEKGIILSPPNLPGWDHVNIVKIFIQEFGGEVFLMNDANASALAEWKFGAGQGCDHMVFLTSGTGMGAGLILNGRLYEGASKFAGEVGHMRLAADGPLGFGKHGSFEGFCSGGGIARLARLRLKELGKGLPLWAEFEGLTAKTIADAARSGDAFASEIMREVGRKFGEGLAILIDILNPQRIVIGGIFPRCGDLLIEEIDNSISREALLASSEACEILPAMLGETIGSHAAVSAAIYRLSLDSRQTLVVPQSVE